MEKFFLEVPTVHLNGTSKGQLIEDLQEATFALDAAIQKLQACAPHGRDYHIGLHAAKDAEGYDRLQKALAEHSKRVAAITAVKTELTLLIEEIDKQARR